jgi:AcrR family transcriptional regulator
MASTGLRERKKQQTRQTLLEVAGQLFAERGYDGVTVAEIADAANISVKTLFTYFDSKEDLAFADEAELRDALVSAIEQRPAGSSVVIATARALQAMAAENAAAGEVDGVEGFDRSYGDSLALRSRIRRMWEDYEDAVSHSIAASTPGLEPAVARLQAMEVIALVRSLTTLEVRELIAGAPDPRRALTGWIDRAARLLTYTNVGFS